MLGTLLIILLLLLLVGAVPIWPYSLKWGTRPASVLGLLLVIVIALLVLGHI